MQHKVPRDLINFAISNLRKDSDFEKYYYGPDKLCSGKLRSIQYNSNDYSERMDFSWSMDGGINYIWIYVNEKMVQSHDFWHYNDGSCHETIKYNKGKIWKIHSKMDLENRLKNFGV